MLPSRVGAGPTRSRSRPAIGHRPVSLQAQEGEQLGTRILARGAAFNVPAARAGSDGMAAQHSSRRALAVLRHLQKHARRPDKSGSGRHGVRWRGRSPPAALLHSRRQCRRHRPVDRCAAPVAATTSGVTADGVDDRGDPPAMPLTAAASALASRRTSPAAASPVGGQHRQVRQADERQLPLLFSLFFAAK